MDCVHGYLRVVPLALGHEGVERDGEWKGGLAWWWDISAERREMRKWNEDEGDDEDDQWENCAMLLACKKHGR